MARPYTRYALLALLCCVAVVYQARASLIHFQELQGSHGIGQWLIILMLSLVMPWLCLALGFWVAFVRVRDRLAWILLGVLLGFSQIFPGVVTGWGAIYHQLANNTWPAWMLLFGIYFPEPMAFDRRWPWLKWLMIVPLFALAIAEVFLKHELAWAVPVRMAATSCFFAFLGIKSRTETNPDLRRRIMLLHWGTVIGATPTFILVLVGMARGRNVFADTSGMAWFVVFALLLLVLFPVTLAYVIVVERAMDARVAIRQGLQYAFARGGIGGMRSVLGFGIAYAAVKLADRARGNPAVNVAVIGVAFVLIVSLRKLGENITRWTDRRFFREAYKSEQILSGLSENVRTIVETGPLLETVARRISESLHVPQVTLLVDGAGGYQTAYALGCDPAPALHFPAHAVTVRQMEREKKPVTLYHAPDAPPAERAMLKALGSELLLPLVVSEKLVGFISLGPKKSEEPYSATDLQLLQSVATQTGLALENNRLNAAMRAEIARRERLNRELEIAREVQERLLPQNLPAVAGLEYAGHCRPALGVGGDYYDFIALEDGSLGIAIGDVSGKGIAAALLMASLQASLRGQTIAGAADLAALMRNVSRLVYESSSSNRYATFFFARYEPESRTLHYVNAGHNAPMLLRGGEAIRLEASGPVVGLLAGASYEQSAAVLAPGDVLIAFTDGISEAMNAAGEEWGEEGLLDAARRCAALPAPEIIRNLMEAADAFAAGAPQHDDMTVVVAKVQEAGIYLFTPLTDL